MVTTASVFCVKYSSGHLALLRPDDNWNANCGRYAGKPITDACKMTEEPLNI